MLQSMIFQSTKSFDITMIVCQIKSKISPEKGKHVSQKDMGAVYHITLFQGILGLDVRRPTMQCILDDL